MASVPHQMTAPPAGRSRLAAWQWPLVMGCLAVLYVPTCWFLYQDIWQQEENAHGPIVLAVALWFAWQKRREVLESTTAPKPWLGSVVLALGLLLYVFGRSQEVVVCEVGSLPVVLSGTLLVMGGSAALRALWFPIVFLIFMVPIPTMVVAMLTTPLKQGVSTLVDNILYAAGFPIARSGVTLAIGPYQLLVADACSGLSSMFSLSAMGILYVYLMGHPSTWRNLFLLACVPPLAFAANVVRVITLVLITYYFGDEAGQGFLHGFAGMLLFVIAMMLLFSIDTLLGRLFFRRSETR